MTRTTVDRRDPEVDTSHDRQGPDQPTDCGAARRALPEDVGIALLEAERDHLLGKLRQLDSLAQRVRELEGLPEKLRELEALTGRLEMTQMVQDRQGLGELGQVHRQIERLNEAALRHLALDHQVYFRVRLPWKLRWLRLRRPRGWGKLHQMGRDYKLLSRSRLFDRDWYLARNEDAGADPVLHYLEHGAAKGRLPGPAFDAPGYLELNPDLAAAGVNPLVHYLRSGIHEQRRLPLPPAREAPQASVPRRRSSAERRLWFYLGDTLEWLKVHPQLTGVGRVSTELFFASIGLGAREPILPCVMEPTTARLAEVSVAEQYAFLSERLGRPVEELHRAMAARAGAGRSPQAGDHVLFTGLCWTPPFVMLFEQLSASDVDFSVLVFDIIPIENPELVGEAASRSFAEWLATVVRTASTIFVSSPTVGDKILRWAVMAGLDVKPAIVPITYGVRRFDGVAAREALARDPRTAALAALAAGGFVLSVGTIDRRKNQAFLCRLWRRLLDQLGAERTPQLVLAGRDDAHLGGPGGEFADLIERGKLLVLEGLSDEQVAGLYQACLFSAFPSLSEGYGLPVSESMQYGKLCLSSALPEVVQHAGELCWYFAPGNADGALPLFVRAITDVDARGAAEARIAREHHVETWPDVLRKMLEATRSAPGGGASGASRPPFPGAGWVEPTAALARAARWCSDVDPEVSILVINWNAASLTLECIRQLWAQTEGHTYEIVIADNGSAPADVARLRRLGPGVRLLELGCNRFFGEANNIAAEAARGRYLCLLNNDAFVRRGWLEALVSAVAADPQAGASGPLFLFPDGTVQEAGATVDADGFPVRAGRGQKEPTPDLLLPRVVDYISAAALVVARDVFLEAGGFDLAYEPAYYEDVDLCLKIRALGRKVLYCPTAQVVHIEGSAANGDTAAEARRKALGDLNRDKLLSRWGDYLRARDEGALTAIRGQLGAGADPGRAPATGTPVSRTAVVYTPYAVAPGGGERYLLTMALALARDHRVRVVTPCRYSGLRLRNIGQEFGLDVSPLEVATEEELFAGAPPDLMVAMYNHVVPSVPAHGRVNVFVCQFPFPMDRPLGALDRAVLAGYDAVIVYSEYVRSHLQRAVQSNGLPALPVHIVSPPVPQFEGDAERKKRMILSVGRFFVSEHSKRQDLLIEAFKRVASRFDPPVELHLAGASTPSGPDMDFLARLRVSAEGAPVHFHVNATRETLRELYRDATVYWHGTGLGVDLEKQPERAEHFGISPLEAMSAGAVPFAFDAAGPSETIAQGETGFLYRTLDELGERTVELLADPAKCERMGRAAAARARQFSTEAFTRRLDEVLERIEDGRLGRAAPSR